MRIAKWLKKLKTVFMKIEQIIKSNRLDESVKKDVIIYKGESFTFFDTGLTRFVFVNKSKTKVIKILINKRGPDYNQEEIDIYTNASDELKKQLAATELTYNGLIIEQEYVNPIKLDSRSLTIPQMMFAAGCRNEVGWDKEGNLKCFDLDEYKKY